MKKSRVLVVDDHVLFRKGLVGLISSQPGMEMAGEASDGVEAVDKAKALRPDIVLMDIYMPRCNGIEAARLIKRKLPSTHIVMLTASDDERDVSEAIMAGAEGYVLKGMSPETLFELLQGIGEGEAPISPLVAARILKHVRRHLFEGSGEVVEEETLTRRETEILRLIADGLKNQDIAQRLSIAPSTVKSHFHRILAKLEIESRSEAVAYAFRTGIARSRTA